MSHFSVLVRLPASTKIQDFDAAVGTLMKPYKEAGADNVADPEFAKLLAFVDDEAEYLVKYQNESSRMVRLPSGEEFSLYDDRFKNPVLFATPQYVVPEGAERFDLPHTQRYATFEAYMADYCGYESRDPKTGRYGHWTNENGKWDWWVIGGRWTGFFEVGYDPAADRRNYKECWLCGGTGTRPDAKYGPEHSSMWKPTPAGHPVIGKGCNGCSATGYEMLFPTKLRPVGNYVRVRDIDWQAIDAETQRELDAFWDQWLRFCGGEAFGVFDGPHHRALELGLIECMSLSELDGSEWRVLPWDGAETPPEKRRNRCDVLKEVTKDRLEGLYWEYFSPLNTFARLDSSGWVEKGKMGWFGCSSDTPESNLTHAASLRTWIERGDRGDPRDWLVIVDCHT